MKTHLTKKKILFLVVALILVITAITYALLLLTSYRDITFDVRRQPLNLKIVDSNKKTVATFTNSQKINLKDGTYFAYPSGADIDDSAIKFTTNSRNTTIIIDPSISLDTLETTLSEEREDIIAEIITKYPDTIALFTIGRGQMLRQADWYITTLSYKNDSNDNPRDVYKVILNKVDNVWTVVESPQIVPTKFNFPSVPIDVIKNAYNLTKDTL